MRGGSNFLCLPWKRRKCYSKTTRKLLRFWPQSTRSASGMCLGLLPSWALLVYSELAAFQSQAKGWPALGQEFIVLLKAQMSELRLWTANIGINIPAALPLSAYGCEQKLWVAQKVVKSTIPATALSAIDINKQALMDKKLNADSAAPWRILGRRGPTRAKVEKLSPCCCLREWSRRYLPPFRKGVLISREQTCEHRDSLLVHRPLELLLLWMSGLLVHSSYYTTSYICLPSTSFRKPLPLKWIILLLLPPAAEAMRSFNEEEAATAVDDTTTTSMSSNPLLLLTSAVQKHLQRGLVVVQAANAAHEEAQPQWRQSTRRKESLP